MQVDDLARLYQAKSDEELLLLAQRPEHLTPEALSFLHGELSRRRIGIPVESELADGIISDHKLIKAGKTLVVRSTRPAGEFLQDVLQLYRAHFWLFVKLVSPAVILGYIAELLLRNESRALVHQGLAIPGRTIPADVTLTLTVMNVGGRLLEGMIFCLSFAAISVAVEQLISEETPSVATSFAVIPRCLGKFVGISVVLLVLIYVGFAVVAVATFGIYWLRQQVGVHLGADLILPTTYVLYSLVILILSRFGLAVPAVILDKYRIGEAMFRSDELTEGKWFVLASLLAKSIIGGYIAGVLPFWVARLIWAYVHLPVWLLDAASVIGVTTVEPFMFIGFALMYVQSRTVLKQEPHRALVSI